MKSEHATGYRLRRDQPSGKNARNPLLGEVCPLTTGVLIRVRQGARERSIFCPPVATPCHRFHDTIPLSVTRLADDLIRLEEQCRRYGQTYSLGGLQVDNQ